MASAISTNPFASHDPQQANVCGSAGAVEGTQLSRQETTGSYCDGSLAKRPPSVPCGPCKQSNPNESKPAIPGRLLSQLSSVYATGADPFTETESSAGECSQTHSGNAGFACVVWELENLPVKGDLVLSAVTRLEHLKACSDEARLSLRGLVAQRQKDLTKSVSVLGELRKGLERLRRESTAIRVGLSQFRQDCLLPSLDITKQQHAKLLLQREMQQLLQIQRMDAILMAAENSCVNRQLPLQAALLMEGAALFHPPKGTAPESSEPTGAAPQVELDALLRSGIQKMQHMLEALKADLSAALQAAARSLPPPPCGCGWRLPEPFSRSASHGGSWRCRTRSGTATAGAFATGEGAWPSYYSALAAFALLPPSSSVGSALSAAVAAAAAAATRQVLCAFVPADAAAFSEVDTERLEAQRACARLLLCLESNKPSSGCALLGADAVSALPSAGSLASFVDEANSVACCMTLLGVQYNMLAGASSLMVWHASKARRLLAQVHAERKNTEKSRSEESPSEGDLLEFLGTNPASDCRNSAASALCCDAPFKDTYDLVVSATQRLKGLPSSLRMALFLLQVRQQFLCQRSTLWQRMQQQMAEVLEAIDLDMSGPTAVCDCLSLMRAVHLFVGVGESKPPVVEEAAAHGGPSVCRLSEVLLLRVRAAIESLQETHVRQMLQYVRAETWQRIPVLRRIPLVVLRASKLTGGALPLLPESVNPSAIATSEGHGNAAEAGGGISRLCSGCGEVVVGFSRGNPFSSWQPGVPLGFCASPEAVLGRQEATADVELAAIEEELRAVGACGSRKDEPPVSVAASQAAAKALMQYWQLAVSAPQLAAAAVRAMIRLMGFYVAAVAASTLPEETCSLFVAPPPQVSAVFVDPSSRSRAVAHADAARLRCRLPHLHWLLYQVDKDLGPLQKKLLRGGSIACNDLSGSHTSAGSRVQQSPLCGFFRPMARLASPGALWGLAERVAAVESAKDLLEALSQQLHLQGIVQGVGEGDGESRAWRGEQLRRLPAAVGCETPRGLLCSLPPEERQQLWRLLAATRCSIEDLRALVYRQAAASLCQSTAFVASFKQAAAEGSTEGTAAVAAARMAAASSSNAAVLPRPPDSIPRSYAAAVQQHRREVADLFWKIRCAGSGSIPADVQLRIWRCVWSQTVADAIDALSVVPLAADFVERCLNPGPLVAVAEALRLVIAEARLQYGKAAAAAGVALTTEHSASGSLTNLACGHPTTAPGGADVQPVHVTAPTESLLDLRDADFDCFLDVCSRTAPEIVRWCHERHEGSSGHRDEEEKCKTLPLRIMVQMLQRLEDVGLLQKGQTADFESKQSQALMQIMQKP
ncbi:hypothetical protein cyc_06387 [Cyclospora cayetanensis]|uniref:Uncharacterized protein n=1 Tax=Cyclospora cayetanensis TaxID=88456 RepID=A0A1D3DAF3_9EIME|nr:hypothetical protein cyc_06387 [Cyclospora cayetanensis]